MLGSTLSHTTKTRGTTDQTFSLYPLYRNGVFEQWLSSPDPIIFERISYENGKDVWFKNCLHVRRQIEFRTSPIEASFSYGYTPTPAWEFRWPYGSWTYDIVKGNLPFCDKYDITYEVDKDSLLADAMPLNSADLEKLLVDGLRVMLPRVEQFTERFNLISFVYELRDLKSMFSVWSSSDSFLKNLSGGVLNVELGWKPFIADCQKLSTKVFTLMDMIRKWNKDAAAGEIWSRHANLSSSLPSYLPSAGTGITVNTREIIMDGTGSSIYDPVSGTYGHHVIYADCSQVRSDEFRTHIYFRPRPIDIRDIEQKLGVWYDGLGMGDGMSIVWNAIPFSFVVDWFYGIGDFLEQFELSVTELGFDIVDFGYSYKKTTKSEGRSFWTNSPSPDHSICNDGHFKTSELSYLRRRAHCPLADALRFSEGGDVDWSALLTFNCPTWKQAWIGFNLAAANMRF